MLFPSDAPTWLVNMFHDMESRVELGVAAAKTADESLKASGAFGLWVALKEEINLLHTKEQIEAKERSRRLNARIVAG